MDVKVQGLLTEFFTEAHEICGSEGLFQSLFYHHARKYFSRESISREVTVPSGSIDFVITDGDVVHAFELKGGANGHRNSLSKMKEVEKTGKGLSHDLKKLKEYRIQSPDHTVHTWLVCVDLKSLRIAFSEDDLNEYAGISLNAGTTLAYLSQEERSYKVFNEKKVDQIDLIQTKPATYSGDPRVILKNPSFWSRYFKQTEVTDGLECMHVGQFYDELRKTGLGWNQCASEIFFNCNKYGTRKYYMPDFAVFGKENTGQFQLFGDYKRIIENDQFKLPNLAAVFEFKGGESFQKKALSKKTKDIAVDLDKLANKIRPSIENGIQALQTGNKYAPPMYIMVVTDQDPRLLNFIESSRKNYQGELTIEWYS